MNYVFGFYQPDFKKTQGIKINEKMFNFTKIFTPKFQTFSADNWTWKVGKFKRIFVLERELKKKKQAQLDERDRP